MPSYKDSPKPLRKSDPNPLFKEGDDGYVVKALTPLQRQRREDGTPHTKLRPSSIGARDYDLFIGEDKVEKSVEAQATRDDIDPDEVIKAYMGGAEDEEKSYKTGAKVVNAVASAVPTPDHK